MDNNKPMVKYGVDELTISINKNDRKTEVVWGTQTIMAS